MALPFERLFGLAADAQNDKALAKVFAIKENREDHKPISVIIPNLDSLEKIAQWTPVARKLAKKHWPGILTILLPALAGVPAALVNEEKLIGVRLPSPCPAQRVAQESCMILTATSANISGSRDVTSHAELTLLKGVDLIIEGTVEGPPGSTVVDASKTEPKVVRQGAVNIDQPVEGLKS